MRRTPLLAIILCALALLAACSNETKPAGIANVPSVSPPAGVATRTTTAATGGTNCSPAYPGVCIPPAPPDLDCGDITFRRFQVLRPDPHNFDADGNGIGCETG